jgi:hypothetical protein
MLRLPRSGDGKKERFLGLPLVAPVAAMKFLGPDVLFPLFFHLIDPFYVFRCQLYLPHTPSAHHLDNDDQFRSLA